MKMGFFKRLVLIILLNSVCILMASIPWEMGDTFVTHHITNVFLNKRSNSKDNLSIFASAFNKKLSQYKSNKSLSFFVPEALVDSDQPVDSAIDDMEEEAEAESFEMVDLFLTFLSCMYIICISYGQLVISLFQNFSKLSKHTEKAFYIVYKLLFVVYYFAKSNIKHVLVWYSNLKPDYRIYVSTTFYVLCMILSLHMSFILIPTNYHSIYKCSSFFSILFFQALVTMHLKTILPHILLLFGNVVPIFWSVLILVRALLSTEGNQKPYEYARYVGSRKRKAPIVDTLGIEISCLLEFWLVITCIDMVPLIKSFEIARRFISHVVIFFFIESVLHVYIAVVISKKWIDLISSTLPHVIIRFSDCIIYLVTGCQDMLWSRCIGDSNVPTVLEIYRNTAIEYVYLGLKTCLGDLALIKIKENRAWIIANFFVFNAPQVFFLILPRFLFDFYLCYTTTIRPVILTCIALKRNRSSDLKDKLESLIIITLAFITRLILSTNYIMKSSILFPLFILISRNFVSTTLSSYLNIY